MNGLHPSWPPNLLGLIHSGEGSDLDLTPCPLSANGGSFKPRSRGGEGDSGVGVPQELLHDSLEAVLVHSLGIGEQE